METRQAGTSGNGVVGRLGRLEGLLAQHDDDSVDRGVHGLDPPEVGLHDLGAGRLLSPVSLRPALLR